jgi:uncharacterized membrane protein
MTSTIRTFSRKLTGYATFAVLSLLALPAVTTSASAQKFTSFDAPGSGSLPFFGTEAKGINILGAVTGDVTGNDGATHGFVRTLDGKFTEFDVPGASLTLGFLCVDGGIGTCPIAINDFGVVAGDYGDDNGVFHGFVRSPFGAITTFDVPGEGTDLYEGTFVSAVNDFGGITGYDYDSNSVGHGFLRTPQGKIISFDVSGAADGTYPLAINNLGVIVGTYYDSTGFGHVFTRAPDGKITTFDPPGSLSGPYGAVQAYINDLGVIAGSFADAADLAHGFQLNPGGKYVDYQIPGGGANPGGGTYVTAVNLAGTATGWIYDNNFESHIFVRYANGKASTYDIPAPIAAPNTYFGAAAWAINSNGIAAGRWRDTNYARHGFILLPTY